MGDQHMPLLAEPVWVLPGIHRYAVWLLCLIHWGQVTHICVSKLTTVDSDNGLPPGRRQAIIWTTAGILLTEPLGTHFSEIVIEIHTFAFNKMHLKVWFGKWQQFPWLQCINILLLRFQVSDHQDSEELSFNWNKRYFIIDHAARSSLYIWLGYFNCWLKRSLKWMVYLFFNIILSKWHMSLTAIARDTRPVPCHIIKYQQLNWSSGVHRWLCGCLNFKTVATILK